MAMNALVFPCGSEIGLEIHRSLVNKKGITLFGMSSVDDHGRYVYENYLSGCPFVTHDEFIDHVKMVVDKYKIDVIYPANEITLLAFKRYEAELCKVIGPSLETVEICNSKLETYIALKGIVKIPEYRHDTPHQYPVFIKPIVGHSGIGCRVINDDTEMATVRDDYNNLFLEYLPGREYTIDCFADQYAEGRERKRINNGISVGTIVAKDDRFQTMAKAINSVLNFPGAWFFQVKENITGELVLMEVGARLAGSSSLSRLRGVNVALLNLYAEPVRIKRQDYITEVSRSFDVKSKIDYDFENVYIDLDDTLIFGDKVNYKLLGLLYKFRNEGKHLYLITRSAYDDAMDKLRQHAIPDSIFTFTIHVRLYERKKDYMRPRSILIDDSFAEREDVMQPAFDIDIVDSLL
jgi:predicted ATP-grasp superfamily ATP-dependent carboligase